MAKSKNHTNHSQSKFSINLKLKSFVLCGQRPGCAVMLLETRGEVLADDYND